MKNFGEEEKLVMDMVEYFNNNKYNHNDGKMRRKLIEYITKLCKLEANKLGYKVKKYTNKDEDIIDRVSEDEDNGVLKLIFISKYGNSDMAAGYGRNYNFTTPRCPIIVVTDYGIEYISNQTKSESVNFCALIIRKILHEFRHMQQNLIAMTGVSSNIGMQWAKETAIRSSEELYNSSLKERDANIHSAKLVENILNTKVQGIHNFVFIEDGGKKDIEEYISDSFDEYIKDMKNQDILKKFPILKKEYNDDGTRKKTIGLINNMNLEINDILKENELCNIDKKELISDCKEMYFEIIYRSMMKCSNKEISQLVSQKKIVGILREMKVYFTEKKEKEKTETENFFHFDIDGQIDLKEQLNLRDNYYQGKIDYLDSLLKKIDELVIDSTNSKKEIYIGNEEVNELGDITKKLGKETIDVMSDIALTDETERDERYFSEQLNKNEETREK